MTQKFVHASCVAFGRRGVLIRGPSGSGKSQLLLRLIDAEGFGLGIKSMRATLVADDQVAISFENGKILATAPPTLSGKLEIRGQGIVELAYLAKVNLIGVVDLVQSAAIERMPAEHDMKTNIEGVSLPRLTLDAMAPAAPAQLRAFVTLNSFSQRRKKR